MAKHQHTKGFSEDVRSFETQHMNRKNPFWLATVISSLVALIAFAYELFATNSGNERMTWIFAGILIVSLICLGLFQQRYRKWEIEHNEQETPAD
jgi:membrane protein YdbS with pleckstrin-like domain